MCSSAYALRSYLYLLVHTLIAGPAALWLGAGPGASMCLNHPKVVMLAPHDENERSSLLCCFNTIVLPSHQVSCRSIKLSELPEPLSR